MDSATEITATKYNDGGVPWRSSVTWAWAGLSLLLASVALVMAIFLAVKAPASLVPPPHMFFSPLSALIFSVTGALIASGQPRNPIGWLLEAVGFLSAVILLDMAYYGMVQYVPLPGQNLAVWLMSWVWIPPTLLPLTLLLIYFPDGRLLSTRWRPILWASILGLVGMVFFLGFTPDPVVQEAIDLPEPNPFALQGTETIMKAMLYVSASLAGMGILGSVVSVVVRFRRSQGVRRAQMKWLAYAGSFVLIGILLGSALSSIFPDNDLVDEVTIVITDLTVMGIVIAVGVAIVRHGLYDIDLLINRTIVYLTLTGFVIGIYILIVSTLGAVFQAQATQAVSLAATGIVAVGFQPLRDRLQRGVNRMLYGERDEPYRVLSRLGRRLEGTLAPDAVLPTIVETVAQALKLPYVAIAFDEAGHSHTATSIGEHTPDQFVLPLTYQSEPVGRLICGLRAANEPFTTAERTLLQDVAHQAGIAVHAVRLTYDLQRARRRLVRTREEERRRIRRDLHDGLGPVLASQRLKIGSARTMLQDDPESADEMLMQIEEVLTAALGDIRNLVYDLRPPALDELGLVRAIQQSLPRSPRLKITLEAADDIPPLPAAVDVAAYRIVQEALTNIVRHAQASCAVVAIQANSSLRVSIEDDGAGLTADHVPGVGLASMRERAEELGGTFELTTSSGQGTSIQVVIPLEDTDL